MASTILQCGQPTDDKPADNVTLALRTPNQAREIATRIEREADRMAAEMVPGSVSIAGRLKK